jgi:ATP-dependent Clp protease ATP-binding subunit ClpB
VVLFDEIEKAHPDVFNILLQLLDDGRLTDSQGRTVDFRNAVVIMTSNVGGQLILEHGAGNWDEAERLVQDALRQTFKPEFLNRVDDIIVFRPLGRDDLLHVVDLQLAHVEELLADRKIKLQVTDEAKEMLLGEGFDPAYGARPLKRAIQRHVQNPLAMSLLEGEFGEGDTIVVSRDKVTGDLAFARVQVTAVEPSRAGV